MYNKMQQRFARNKYSLFIFGMLGAASLASFGLWRWRESVTSDANYDYLAWNLFLAWIPFLIAYFTYTFPLRRPWIFLLMPIAVILWLIFFPNAPYLLTDFIHLSYPNQQEIETWYDVLMLLWFSFTGLLLGVVSLFMMQEIIRREIGRWVGWGFVTIVTALGSIGVYVGRFLRWDSWDILHHPLWVARFILQQVGSPSSQAIVFTTIFGAFFLFLYLTLYAFGHLLLERQSASNAGGQ